MSHLLIDIGNTRLKWLLAADLAKALPPAQALAHAGEPALALCELARQLATQKPTSVWIAHVTGGKHEAALVAAVQQQFGLAPHFARSASAHSGLRIAYTEPQRLGVDRFLTMLALWAERPSAFSVASAGTALTFDAVDDQGQHLGGVIAPGLDSMIRTTLGNTRFATDEIHRAAAPGLGESTEACVQLGAVNACAGLLERLARQYPARCVLTGGDAALLAPLLAGDWQLRRDLVLQGLARYAQQQA